MGITIQNPPLKTPDPDPEEVELSGKQMSFLEHLEELRVRLLRSIYSVIITSGICFWYHQAIYAYMAKPLTDTLTLLHLPAKLVYTNPVDPFNLYIKLSIMGGIFLASPFVLYQLWMFISPGLYRNEKKYIWPFVLMTSGLFMSGGFFAYKLALPKVFRFLLEFASQFTPMVTINEYWDLAITLVVSVGLVFELPVVILLLSIFGIVTPKFLLKNFRYAVLVTAVIALGIVPSNDLASIFVVWIPLVGLYFLSIGLSWLVYLRKNRKKKKEKDDEA
ncbi:MAG: twin-arginine translocase subunit TatC [Terriglobia bacterium]|jgi:sec-independent protein translocase protein TatC